MKILAINTASSLTSIALLRDGGNYEAISQSSWQAQNNEAQKLMPEISNLLKKNHTDFDELSGILAISGPGSFTGLRVGVTTANAISYLTKAPIFAVNTFEYWWTSAPASNTKLNLALLIFAGAKGVYLSFSPESHELIPLEKIPKILKANRITEIFGDISAEQKEFLKNFRFIEGKKSFGEICSEILSEKNIKPQKIITPLYIKSPDITESKKSCFT